MNTHVWDNIPFPFHLLILDIEGMLIKLIKWLPCPKVGLYDDECDRFCVFFIQTLFRAAFEDGFVKFPNESPYTSLKGWHRPGSVVRYVRAPT